MLTRVIYGLAEREKISFYFYDSESSLSMHCLEKNIYRERELNLKKKKNWSPTPLTSSHLQSFSKETRRKQGGQFGSH